MDKGNLALLESVARVEKRLKHKATTCLYPGCQSPSIRSHSQHKAGSLSRIAENGHVMGVSRHIAASLYDATPECFPLPRIDYIGVREASTFWGYCNRHDTELFDCLETGNFSVIVKAGNECETIRVVAGAMEGEDITLVLGFIDQKFTKGILQLIYGLAVLLPALGVSVRRLHDIGKSGWWLFLGLVPIIGPIVLLVFVCLDGKPGSNEYGPNPKGV